jgi:HNH endonuclease
MNEIPQVKWKKSFSGIHNSRSDHDKFWEKVDIKSDDECWEWLGAIDRCGYGKFGSKNFGNGLAHRFSWKDSFGDIPKGMYVCHHCDNPSCVNPKHLFLGTQKDNMQDMKNKSRSPKQLGEANPKAKLSNSDVFEIYRLHNSGVTNYKLSKMYRVCQSNIKSIVSGNTWKNLWETTTHVR